MNPVHCTRCGFATLLALLLFSSAYAAEEELPLDTGQIEKLTGAKGKFDSEENVFKVSVPRTDLNVTVAGVTMKPPMRLTSWAAFTPARDHVMVMGDLLVLEEQVNRGSRQESSSCIIGALALWPIWPRPSAPRSTRKLGDRHERDHEKASEK